MAELLTEQASDLMFVGLAKAEGIATGVKLRCETNVPDYVTKWLQEEHQEKAGLRTPYAKGGPCLMDKELKECRDKIKKRNTPTTEKLVKREELRTGHALKQAELLEVEVRYPTSAHDACF